MNLRGAKPIPDLSIKSFIETQNLSSFIYDQNIREVCLKKFDTWLKSSNLNQIQGLDSFSNRDVCSGTIQAFDHFYWRHKDKRFRIFPGEFMYHKAVLKNGANLVETKDDDLKNGDVLIVSIPFSDFGSVRSETKKYLHECDKKNIPVLLDFAYLPASKNVFINLNDHESVETITFSMSKAFYGAEYLRIGFRMERYDYDDAIDVFNSVDMVNRHSLAVASSYMDTYDFDYPWRKYKQAYHDTCCELDLIKTDCVMFGLSTDRFYDHNRGTDFNRVCISDLIGEKINEKN